MQRAFVIAAVLAVVVVGGRGFVGIDRVVGTGVPNRDDPSNSSGRQLGFDRDCSDFSAHREAQKFYEANPPGDPHRLDGDDGGWACERHP